MSSLKNTPILNEPAIFSEFVPMKFQCAPMKTSHLYGCYATYTDSYMFSPRWLLEVPVHCFLEFVQNEEISKNEKLQNKLKITIIIHIHMEALENKCKKKFTYMDLLQTENETTFKFLKGKRRNHFYNSFACIFLVNIVRRFFFFAEC